MNNKINISVIIPVFNHENFITQCLDSLIDQDYKNWEGIIINELDRSDVELCNKFKVHSPKTKIKKDPNRYDNITIN